MVKSPDSGGEIQKPRLPGGEIATRPLHFLWICDCSGSMSGDKIQKLNRAIREAIPHMQKVATENPHADVLLRVLKFSSNVQWHVATPTPVRDFKWTDLQASGETKMGTALRSVADQLKIPPMADRALPPVLVLITDGQPTDDFAGGLKELMNQPWGQRAVRIAIGIGHDVNYDVLQKFIGNPEIKPLQANSPEALVNYIHWASTIPLKAASNPPSVPQKGGPQGNVVVPSPPPVTGGDDVW